ncbi:saccharopine dehydrogenase family protein [Microbacterium sp. 18062]|uniref:saccharopine dehydrogenase family protein n=1 Tax=Microbacterium sp. 18062 TaxID=2681410 RepID=UPI00135A9872|nr:saccharopine dehydrogenase NADP-binding domain-containing protein [Microbacterium sp. 18062]
MKVVVVGGAGAMGAAAVAVLAGMSEFREIVVADRDAEGAQRIAAALPGHVRAQRFDADVDDFADLLDGAWGVLNALGPFARFGSRILSASIARRCHYVDIDDDWEPTLEAFELHERAADAGISAVIGMGASPGLTNLLAVLCAAALDTVDRILTGWNIEAVSDGAVGGRPSAALMHLVHQLTGEIRLLDDGELKNVRPLRRTEITFPGYGRIPGWGVGHPEPITLPRVFPNLLSCANIAVGSEATMEAIGALMTSVDAGRMSRGDAALALGEVVAGAAAAALTRQTPSPFAHASGLREGTRTAVVGYMVRRPEGGMPAITATPAALGMQSIARGEVQRVGVSAPEEAMDPALILGRLAAYCPPGEGDIYVVRAAAEQ